MLCHFQMLFCTYIRSIFAILRIYIEKMGDCHKHIIFLVYFSDIKYLSKRGPYMLFFLGYFLGLGLIQQQYIMSAISYVYGSVVLNDREKRDSDRASKIFEFYQY